MDWIFHSALIFIFIIGSSSAYYSTADQEAVQIFHDRCDEARRWKFGHCQEDWGRVYLFDNEVKTFDEARRWCRQKFDSHPYADLIAIEDCPQWKDFSNVLRHFYSLDTKETRDSFVWSQIVSGPEMKPSESSSEEVTPMQSLKAITNPGGTEFLAENSCFPKIIPTGDEIQRAHILTFRVSNTVITPSLVPLDTKQQGHALCQFHRPGGYQPTQKPPDPPEEPSTVPPTAATPVITTGQPVIVPTTQVDPEAVKINNYFTEIREEIKGKPEASINLTQKFLRALSSDEFVLKTTEHIHEVISITKDLFEAFEEKVTTVSNKSEALNRRVKFTENLCNIYSEILEDRNEESWQGLSPKEEIHVAHDILVTTEQVGFKVACDLEEEGNFFIDGQAIQMEVFSFANQTTDFIERLAFPTKPVNRDNTAQIVFPSGVSLKMAAAVSRCSYPSGLGSILKTLGKRMDPGDNKTSIVSDLMAFSFGESVGDLDVQVSLSHNQLKKRGDTVTCVFWDTRSLSWNSSGCALEPYQSTRGKSVCRCNHLTNFAILMDISGRQEDDPVKSILTLICLTASILSLILTVFFLFAIPTLKSRRTTITANLCVCLLIVNFLIMFGVERTENPFWCRIISGLLFYSLAGAFSWMLLEGYFLYQMIIVVFKGAGYFRTRWFYLIGYGLALIWLTAAISIVGFDGLYDESSYYCWISNPLYPDRIWIFVGPVVVILALNMVIFVKSIRVARLSNLKKKNSIGRSTSAEQKTQAQLVRRWFKGWLSLMVLLGITWVTGFLYIHESFEWFSYVFIVINSLQGVFIFLFEIVTNSKARPAIVKIVSGKFPSSYLSSLSKTSSSNPLSSLSSRNSRPLGHNLSNEKNQSNGIFERKKFNNYDTMELT